MAKHPPKVKPPLNIHQSRVTASGQLYIPKRLGGVEVSVQEVEGKLEFSVNRYESIEYRPRIYVGTHITRQVIPKGQSTRLILLNRVDDDYYLGVLSMAEE